MSERIDSALAPTLDTTPSDCLRSSLVTEARSKRTRYTRKAIAPTSATRAGVLTCSQPNISASTSETAEMTMT